MKTCEERIDAVLKSTMANLETLWNLYKQDPEAYDFELGNWLEYWYGFDYVEAGTFDDQPEGYFRWLISGGGPSDGFHFYARQGCGVWWLYRIEYWFTDWLDSASRDVTDSQVLSEVFDWLLERM